MTTPVPSISFNRLSTALRIRVCGRSASSLSSSSRWSSSLSDSLSSSESELLEPEFVRRNAASAGLAVVVARGGASSSLEMDSSSESDDSESESPACLKNRGMIVVYDERRQLQNFQWLNGFCRKEKIQIDYIISFVTCASESWVFLLTSCCTKIRSCFHEV